MSHTHIHIHINKIESFKNTKSIINSSKGFEVKPRMRKSLGVPGPSTPLEHRLLEGMFMKFLEHEIHGTC